MTSDLTKAPKVGGVIETALYVDDLARAVAFYDDLFGFPHFVDMDRLVALDVAGRRVLLLVLRRLGRGPVFAWRRDPGA